MMKMIIATVAMLVLLLGCPSSAKVYRPCDLAKDLVRLGLPKNQIADWICLVQHESSYDTKVIGGPNTDGSRDHGLFQINDKYWCAPPGPHNECNVNCDRLRDDDISTAVKCVKLIYKRHQFEAWYGWVKHCKGKDLSSYVKGCVF